LDLILNHNQSDEISADLNKYIRTHNTLFALCFDGELQCEWSDAFAEQQRQQTNSKCVILRKRDHVSYFPK
jgi:hypothetical protein